MITLESTWTSAGQQRYFRDLLTALSFPGRIVTLLGQSQSHSHSQDRSEPAHVAMLACLADAGSTLADPQTLLSERQWGLLAATPTAVDQAALVVLDGRRPVDPTLRPQCGTLEEPEDGATLIIIVDALGDGPLHIHARGPGIESENTWTVAGLDPTWFVQRAAWIDYPRGVDIILADSQRIVGIPRTTVLTWEA